MACPMFDGQLLSATAPDFPESKVNRLFENVLATWRYSAATRGTQMIFAVRVLIGSTQKMGTGTNFQKRLVALHHLDAPWKPAEVEQRDGATPPQ